MMTMTTTNTITSTTKMTPAPNKMPLLLTTMSMVPATLTTMLTKMAVALAPVVAAPGSSSFLGPSKPW